MSSSPKTGRRTGRRARLHRAAAAAAAGSVALLAIGCSDLFHFHRLAKTKCDGSGRLCELPRCSSNTECRGEACIEGHCQSFLKISAGGATTCAALSGGGVQCWGLNSHGQCGQVHVVETPGGTTLAAAMVQAWRASVPLEDDVKDVSVGGDEDHEHACALTDGNQVWCWGVSSLLPPSAEAEWVGIPKQIVLPEEIEQIERVFAGSGRGCLIGQTQADIDEGTSRLWCWGENGKGQTMPGASSDRASPGYPVPHLDDVKDVALGLNHTCALTEESLYCWGDAGSLPCGDPSGADDARLIEIPLDGLGAVHGIAVGDSHTCIATDAGIDCWDLTSAGQSMINRCVQDGSTCCESPRHVADAPAASATYSIAATGTRTCASWPSGDTECWSHPSSGTDAASGNDSQHHLYEGFGAAEVAVGSRHGCMRAQNERILCWGDNTYGQLGLGTVGEPVDEPTEQTIEPNKPYAQPLTEMPQPPQ